MQAAETYRLASKIAANEARLELQQSWRADAAASGRTSTPGTLSSYPGTLDGGGTWGAVAGEEDKAGSPAYDPLLTEVPLQTLSAFWEEQGLSASTALRLAEKLSTGAEAAGMRMGLLRDRVSSLQRVLVDCPVPELAAREPALVSGRASTTDIVSNLVTLVTSFPGRDVTSMVTGQPQLLTDTALGERVSRITGKLMQLHPSDDVNVVLDVIAENPTLLYRMDFHLGALSLDDLPIELLNMFVLTGQGLGYLYRYYGAKNQGLDIPLDWQQPPPEQ